MSDDKCSFTRILHPARLMFSMVPRLMLAPIALYVKNKGLTFHLSQEFCGCISGLINKEAKVARVSCSVITERLALPRFANGVFRSANYLLSSAANLPVP